MKYPAYKAAAATALIASMLAAPSHAGASIDLSDVGGSFAKDAILELAEKGIINGNGDGRFNPTGNITRQDFAIILAKALTLDVTDVPATSTFKDVPADHYSYKYVEAAAKAGLISGTGEGKFGTGSNLTRQEMAVIFVRSLGVDATGYGAKLQFGDQASIAPWAKDAVSFAVEKQLMGGTGDGRFNPTGQAERQQVAAVASRFLAATGGTAGLPIREDLAVDVKLVDASAVGYDQINLTFNSKVKTLDVSEFLIHEMLSWEKVAVTEAKLSPDGRSAVILVDRLIFNGRYRVVYNSYSASFDTPAAERLDVTVSDSSVYPGEKAQASAKAYGPNDPTGIAVKAEWSVDGGGSIDQSGSFTGSDPGAGNKSVTITAQYQGVRGTAAVTVYPTPPAVAPAPYDARPSLSDVTVGPVPKGSSITAKSSESGTVYLVGTDIGESPSRSALEAYVNNEAHMSGSGTADITGSELLASFSTGELHESNYVLYAVDSIGQVSAPSSVIEVYARPELTGVEDGMTFVLGSEFEIGYNSDVDDAVQVYLLPELTWGDGMTEAELDESCGEEEAECEVQDWYLDEEWSSFTLITESLLEEDYVLVAIDSEGHFSTVYHLLYEGSEPEGELELPPPV